MGTAAGSSGIERFLTVASIVALLGTSLLAVAPTAQAQAGDALCEEVGGEAPLCDGDEFDPCGSVNSSLVPCDRGITSVDLLILENSFLDGTGPVGDCYKSGTEEASGPGEGSYDWCLEVNGQCTITTHTESTTKTEWWTVVLVGEVKTTTSTTVRTVIDCEGNYAMTFTHYGGLGIREAVATQETSDSDTVEKRSCRYVGTGPVGVDSCTTTFSGEWEAHKEADGELEDHQLCKGDWSVHNAPVVSLLGLLTLEGEHSPCWWASDFTESLIEVV